MIENNPMVMLVSMLSISLPAAEFTKQFVTSVVVGKDVVPRLGLHQLETLRTSLMTAIKKSTNPKVPVVPLVLTAR